MGDTTLRAIKRLLENGTQVLLISLAIFTVVIIAIFGLQEWIGPAALICSFIIAAIIEIYGESDQGD